MLEDADAEAGTPYSRRRYDRCFRSLATWLAIVWIQVVNFAVG